MYTVTLNIHTDDDIQGIKEAIAMDLEKYGGVEVVDVIKSAPVQKYICITECSEHYNCQCTDPNWIFERYQDTGCPIGKLSIWKKIEGESNVQYAEVWLGQYNPW